MTFMPRFKKAYGWTDGSKVYLSPLPKASNGAMNVYDDPAAALADAHARGLQIAWEDPPAIDRFKVK